MNDLETSTTPPSNPPAPPPPDGQTEGPEPAPGKRPERLATRPAAPPSEGMRQMPNRVATLVGLVLGQSAERGAEILAELRGLPGLAHASEAELARISHSRRRARVVCAAFELARMSIGQRPRVGTRIAGAQDVWEHMRARLAGAPVEEFWAIAVDVRHRVLSDELLARGSMTGVEVHPRDVFRPLIKMGAASVIFVHNHPSGLPDPSRADIELTARLREVGELCGIAVLDHVVVASGGYVSFAERAWR